MEQTLINIVKNANEAIEQKGTITFTTRSNPKELIVTDTGKGIAKENLQYIFSPFFSTKKDGQGVGLTLIKEILLSHQFQFSLHTVHPGLTVFQIAFLKN